MNSTTIAATRWGAVAGAVLCVIFAGAISSTASDRTWDGSTASWYDSGHWSGGLGEGWL